MAGIGIAELMRLRQLEHENKKLKALVADLTLDKHMLQEQSNVIFLSTGSVRSRDSRYPRSGSTFDAA